MPANTLLRNWDRIYNFKAEAPVRSQVPIPAESPPSQHVVHIWQTDLVSSNTYCAEWLTKHTANFSIYLRNKTEVWDALRMLWGGSLWCHIYAANTLPIPLCTTHANRRVPIWGEGECHSLDSCSRKWLILIRHCFMFCIAHKPVVFMY